MAREEALEAFKKLSPEEQAAIVAQA